MAAIVAALMVSNPVSAGYWTVPIDYYQFEHVRFALSAGSYPEASVMNLSGRPNVGRELDGQAHALRPYSDKERGSAAGFAATAASNIVYRTPTTREAGVTGAASLSFWVRPLSPTVDTMLLSAGTREGGGYSLYFCESGRLCLVTWAGGGAQPRWLISRSPTRALAWQNVILTQRVEGGGGLAPRLALYIDGVLEGALAFSAEQSGLLPRTTAAASRAVIGGASESGWTYDRIGDRYAPYQRPQDSMEPIGKIGAFTNAAISEFRYFGDLQFVCSDKTRPGFTKADSAMSAGTRCDIASDIASFAHDRLEQAGVLARLPYAYDVADRNFEGLNNANVVSDCATCSLPTFTSDEFRQSAALFDKNRVQYRTDVGPLSISNVTWPYSIAFWVEVPDGSSYRPIITGGGVDFSGFSIALGMGGSVQASSWAVPGWEISTAASSSLMPGWHHVAVTFDGPPSSRPSGSAAPSALKLFIDGEFQSSSDLGQFRSPPPGWGFPPISIGGPDSHYATYDPSGKVYVDSTFRGSLSEVLVVGMPITFPQARALASRFPNAYEPSFTRWDYPMTYGAAPGVPAQPGYTYRNAQNTAENGHTNSGYTYDSAHLTFEVDWSKSAPGWRDETTNQPTPECEYVLGGARFYGARPMYWAVEQPASAYLCFSPKRLSKNMPAFSLALYYPKYNKILYLTIVEPMASRGALDKLKDYSSTQGVAGLKTRFELNIGRYNMVLQAKTVAAPGGPAPNYVSAVYQGANALIDQVFLYERGSTDPSRDVTLLWPTSTVAGMNITYVDQKQLLNDLDMKFSKDR